MHKVIQTIFMGSALAFGACGADGVSSPSGAETEAASASVSGSGSVMTTERLGEIVKDLDADLQENPNGFIFKVRERELMMVWDTKADRMRIITPIMQADLVPEEIHARLLQANFDAVLDSRYAIANEIVWAVFIHKLSTLTEGDLKSGIAQTYSAAETFGTTYTSGVIVFGGGDTSSIHEELLEEFETEPGEEDQGI